ncbi:MAG TPA: hypothetical protein VMB18_16010 [Terriglobales bacterium]|nr:hypothetical protein [Terriglobales bacterium]
MPRVFLAFSSLAVQLISFSAVAQLPARVEVAYLLINSSQLQTYDVDASTGVPTPEGKPLTVSPNVFSVVPSPNDHFLYFLGRDRQKDEHLWVYATDSTGAPQSDPIQVLNVKNLGPFEIDPTGKLAYAVENNCCESQIAATSIQLFNVDPQTGLLSLPSKPVASFPQNGPCGDGWSIEGSLGFSGFNLRGSILLDEWLCTAYDWAKGIYFASTVNTKTGALGSEQQVFSWFEDSSGDGVWFTPRALIDYSDPAGGQGDAAVTIYPPSGGTEPVFSCNAQMLEACASGLGGMPDPVGEYMFLQTSQSNVEITRIDLPGKKIVDTGNGMPGRMLTISSDRRLIYTQPAGQEQESAAPIYTFNPATGEVQAGGTIEVPASFSSFVVVPAIREP